MHVLLTLSKTSLYFLRLIRDIISFRPAVIFCCTTFARGMRKKYEDAARLTIRPADRKKDIVDSIVGKVLNFGRTDVIEERKTASEMLISGKTTVCEF